MPIVVEQGCDTSGTWATRPRNAHSGAKFYATDKYRGFIYDDNLKVWLPSDGMAFYDASSKYLVDCFRGSLIDNLYTLNEGNDAQALLPALDLDQQGGKVDLVTGDAGTGTAADASVMTGPLVWEMEEADVATRLFLRAKLSAITNVAMFFGFTDSLASTLEMPATLSTTTFTTNATDGGGFLFDTAATTDTIRGISVAAGVDGTDLDTAIAPVADTYVDMLMVVTPAGVASMYLDDTLYGTITLPVGVDLCPIFIAEARSTASRTASACLLFCHQDG